jgi:hypothetical protein
MNRRDVITAVALHHCFASVKFLAPEMLKVGFSLSFVRLVTSSDTYSPRSSTVTVPSFLLALPSSPWISA